MRSPLAILFNDVHLKTGNEEDILKAFDHMLEYAKKNQIERAIFAGDLFDSRTFQRQKVLLTLDTMLSKLSEYNIESDWIPGNHDKSLYNSFDSFLDVFSYYPGVTLHRGISDISIDGIAITLLPFFSDDMLIPMLEEHKGSDILISHFEMAGSAHLGKVSEKTSINQKLLSKWKKTYLGHYHNHHEISKDIVHLPSFIQASFGEDSNKGFTVLYEDLSYKIIEGKFRKYIKLVIDLDKKDGTYIKSLIKEHKNSGDTVRFEFIGEESRLKALDKSIFKDTGINVQIKYESQFEVVKEYPKLVEYYSKSQVKESFKDFCEKKGLNHADGEEILDNFLKEL